MRGGGTSRPGGAWTNVLLLLVSTLLSLAVAELAARAYWRLVFHASFLHPDRVLYAFYPELKDVNRVRPSRDDRFQDVLLLGGSTLQKEWGEVEQALAERLAYAGHRTVRIHNLAHEAHTSRDSLLKYAALSRARFELVVLYDGINEARVNNVPPALYREDYGHYSWYATVNALAPYHGHARLALPVTTRLLLTSLQRALRPDRYVPTGWPRQDWVVYGSDLRSAVSYRKNLGAILDLARRRGDPVLLLTFATHVPANYERLAFKKGQLDYGRHLVPLEMWGAPDHVQAAVAAHNAVVRDLAAHTPGVRFVDVEQRLSGQARYFNDPCHLTVEGSMAFADALAPTVLDVLGGP
ncbi:MAG TPA: hypothetical protein VFO11_03415 [Candidatus Polarisedimenticolaceae bacterium]|nr:hypothetical protein [Candidatus Polarisedimenticolaceae bacterium]